MTPDAILAFWFADGPDVFRDAWFRRDDAFDAALAAAFGTSIETIVDALQESSRLDPAWWLAMAIAHDQFPRNLFRGSPRAFAYDEKARALAASAIARGMDQALTRVQRLFLYLPSTHSESLEDQDRCIALVTAMAEGRPDLADCVTSAHAHRAVIARFGRFPHRNAALGRANTAKEAAYLAEPGSGF